MPISRDARMDRRRRLLRDTAEADSLDDAAPRRASRRTAQAEESEGQLPKRKAGYSQDVRKACGQRLVQLIPVRRRSFAAVVFVSFLIPALLLAVHYFVHVTGQLQWWRHPLAVALDIGHPRSIAAWLCSQLWLLCLGATILTFQLRRHKLDDYNGEYRLWIWLVLTCLVASVDATTNITELFALALDPWAQAQLGWSGPAVVDLTLAVLIGMLGLRMCSELKVVPMSLLWWLGGLVAWACSAALARPEFQLEMSAPIRYWLISAFWLGGLTMIWLAALSYLRSIYVEAQQRFLLRGRLAASGIPMGQRVREALPNWPRLGRGSLATADPLSADTPAGGAKRWALPGVPNFLRRSGNAAASTIPGDETFEKSSQRRKRKSGLPVEAEHDQQQQQSADRIPTQRQPSQPAQNPGVKANQPNQPNQPNQVAGAADEQPAAPRRGLGGFFKRPRAADDAAADEKPTNQRQNSPVADEKPKSSLTGWLRRPKDNDDAAEYRKVKADAHEAPEGQTSRPQQQRSDRAQKSTTRATEMSADGTPAPAARSWLPKLSRPKLALPKFSRPKLPRPKLPSFSRGAKADKPKPEKESGGFLSRLKMPKLSLSALKLQPPDEDAAPEAGRSAAQSTTMRPVAAAPRQLPGTDSPADHDDYFDDEEQDGRPLSKAERKRLRRNQQQRRSA